MTVLRDLAAGLMSRGVISAGWYSILTGVAMLVLAYALGSSSPVEDTAVLVVAVVLTATGAWQLERGIRSELLRRRVG